MPINPHEMKPVEVMRLLNSTSLGTTLSRDRVYRQQDLGGRQFGDGETIDIVRYAGWLFARWWEGRDHGNDAPLEDEAPVREPSVKPLNPLALTLPDAAWLLSRAIGKTVTEGMVRSAVEAGCPVDENGRLNLVYLAAWINKKEAPDGD